MGANDNYQNVVFLRRYDPQFTCTDNDVRMALVAGFICGSWCVFLLWVMVKLTGAI